MANTLTNLTPELYDALDVVSRELVGFIPAVSRDSSAARAAKDQVVRSFATPSVSTTSITPGLYAPDSGDQTIGNVSISISKAKMVPIRWNGEEQRAMDTGPGYNAILRDQFAQAMRALVNEVEADIAGLYYKASRAVVPAGTTLFDSTGGLKDIANVRKILMDNGAPANDLQLVLNTTAGAALRGLNQYAGANTAGTTDILRQGVLLDVYGVQIRESGQVITHVAGTADGSTDLGSTDYAVGATSLAMGASGSGTFVKGDVIQIDNSDPNLYVVAADLASVATGSVTLNNPGIRKAITANGCDLDLNTTSLDRNMCFSRSAIHLVTRAPAAPVEGDGASDVMIVQDPRSGLAFEVRMYKQYRQIHYEVGLAWGFQVIKPEHLALLID